MTTPMRELFLPNQEQILQQLTMWTGRYGVTLTSFGLWQSDLSNLAKHLHGNFLGLRDSRRDLMLHLTAIIRAWLDENGVTTAHGECAKLTSRAEHDAIEDVCKLLEEALE